MKKYFRLGLILFCVSLLVSCAKKEEYPIEPQIGFKYYIVNNTFDTLQNPVKQVHVVFSFTDGDGDIGLAESDTLPPYNITGDHYYNLITSYYEKKNGSFVKVAQNSNFRIPILQDLALKKAIRGNIEYQVDLHYPDSDTLKYDFFIYDRALHKSNVVSTPEIILH